MIGYNSEIEVIQNLKDAGCDEDRISAFMEDVRQGKLESGEHLLEEHRSILLDELHKAQKYIDCLDYLLYQMKKRA